MPLIAINDASFYYCAINYNNLCGNINLDPYQIGKAKDILFYNIKFVLPYWDIPIF